MSESMVTIPLREYEDLKEIKKAFEEKASVTYRDPCGRWKVRSVSDSEALKILCEALETNILLQQDYKNQLRNLREKKMKISEISGLL